MNDGAMIEGKTSKKHFIIAFLSGFLLLGGLFATMGITGVAAEVPVAGLGQFNVSFDEMTGKGFKLYGDIYDDNGKAGNKAVPVFVNKIGDVTIKNLKITKHVELPFLNKSLDVVITAGNQDGHPVKITGLTQKAALINGNAEFSGMDISEHAVTPDEKDPFKAVRESFTQGAQTITIKNGSLDTYYLFQEAVSLPGMKVEFK